MKKVFIILCLMVSVISENCLYAGDDKKGNALDQKGYVGSVGGLVNSGAASPIGIGITTSHGYSFGNGLWMGGGISLECRFDQNPSIPVFADVKYALDCSKVDPFVSCKIGLCVWQLGSQVVGYCSPSFGIDYDRWSFFISYENIDMLKFASIGFAWNFR